MITEATAAHVPIEAADGWRWWEPVRLHPGRPWFYGVRGSETRPAAHPHPQTVDRPLRPLVGLLRRAGLPTLRAHPAPPRALCFAAHGGGSGRLFSAGDDGRLCEWAFPFVGVALRSAAPTIAGVGRGGASPSSAPGSAAAAAASSPPGPNEHVRCDTVTRLLTRRGAHKRRPVPIAIRTLALLPGGGGIVAGCGDGSLRAWVRG